MFLVLCLHDCSQQSSTLLEGLKDPHLSCDFSNVDVGDTEVITVGFPADASGTINFTIDGRNYSHTISTSDGGSFVFNIEGLTAGIKNFLVTYSGDVNYKRSIASVQIEVSKVTPDLDVNVVKDEGNYEIIASGPRDFSGPMAIQIGETIYYNYADDDEFPFWMTDGQFVLVLEEGETKGGVTISDGTVIIVILLGDDKYESTSTSITLQ